MEESDDRDRRRRIQKLELWEPMTCCLCFTRKTGTFILGYLGIIASTLAIFLFIDAAVEKASFCHYGSCFPQGVILYFSESFIILFVHGIFSVLLVIGAHKERPKLMVPYLVLHAIILLMNVTQTIIRIIIMMIYYSNAGGIIGVFVVSTLMICLHYHFFCVVLAYHKELIRGNSQEPLMECNGLAPKSLELRLPVPHIMEDKPPPYDPSMHQAEPPELKTPILQAVESEPPPYESSLQTQSPECKPPPYKP